MLTCHVYRHGESVDTVPIDRVRATIDADEKVRVWIDAQEPDEDDLSALRTVVELHPLTVEDVLHWNQRSKIEFFDRYFTVVLHALELGEHDEVIDREVHAIAFDRILITLRRHPGGRMGEALDRIRAHPELAGHGPAAFLYVVLDGVIDRYLSVAERFEELSDEFEDRVFGDPTGTAVQQDLFRLKRQVSVFRRTVAPMRETIDLIRDRPDFATEAMAPYYRDLLDHVLRALEFTDNVRDLLQSALEAQLSQVSNRTNVIMKRVTSWGSILLVPTLISGIYGMNFTHMPELDWRFGYPMALALMAGTAYLLYRMFRRRDWL